MSAILALIGPKIIGVMALVLAALGLAFQQRLAGAKAERNKQAAKEAEARAQEIDRIKRAAGASPVGVPDNDPRNRDRKP